MNRFVRNPSFARDMSRHPLFLARLRAVTEAEVRPVVESLASQVGAPWMRRKGARATIVVEQSIEGVRVVNTDHAGHLMEFGSANNPPHAPLRRGVRAAGLRLDE